MQPNNPKCGEPGKGRKASGKVSGKVSEFGQTNMPYHGDVGDDRDVFVRNVPHFVGSLGGSQQVPAANRVLREVLASLHQLIEVDWCLRHAPSF